MSYSRLPETVFGVIKEDKGMTIFFIGTICFFVLFPFFIDSYFSHGVLLLSHISLGFFVCNLIKWHYEQMIYYNKSINKVRGSLNGIN